MRRLWPRSSGSGARRRARPRGDRLDVLATLIDAYEAEYISMDPPDPIEAIRFRMERRGLTRKDLGGLTRKDLEGIIGTRTRIAEVLSSPSP